MGHNIHMIVFIISSGRGAQKSVFVGRKRLDVAIDAAMVYYEGETGRVPIFSIPGLSVGTFMKLGFVKIDRNESQKLKCKLLKLLSPQEKKKQVAQAATWVGYDSYEAGASLMHDSNPVLFSSFRVFGQFQSLMTRLSGKLLFGFCFKLAQ